MRTALLVLTLAFAAPLSALAAVSAGISSAPLWLSQSAVTEGDTVQLFTVLYNQSTAEVQGSVDFAVDNRVIDSIAFDLAPGKNQIASASWQATKGDHTLSAATNGTTDGQKRSITLSGTAASLAVTVMPRPQPPAQANAAAASAFIDGLIGSSSPALSSAAQHAVAVAEGLRNDAATYLESKLASSTPAKKGQVLGVSTERAAETAGAASGWWPTVRDSLYRAALLIARSVWLFYPLFAFVFFFILYLLIKSVRRPRSQA
ncbi:MAG TPA: hypothetical protein VHD38_00660 [Candidatus Paceibacterota bacterium]|nr:hypothetical protein [Candidatus Paceibacterota bacterium]